MGRRWSVNSARRRLGRGGQRARRLLIAAAVVAAVIAADRLGWGVQSGDMATYNGRAFMVVRVVDGDTLDVDVPDGDKLVTRIRLWGINAPELAKPWEPAEASQPGAEEAKAALRGWAEHRVVFLELLPHRMRGDFGRVLAYVRDVNGVCLNEQLVKEGYAKADGRWWHPKVAAYDELQAEARRADRGVWSGN